VVNENSQDAVLKVKPPPGLGQKVSGA
jgi:hypothetical protein